MPRVRLAGPGRHGMRGAGEVVQVIDFCFVEPQHDRDCAEHFIGDSGKVAALESRVVVDTHSGEECDFFTPQARHSTVTPADDAHVLRGDAISARAKKIAYLGLTVHEEHCKPGAASAGGPGSTRNNAPFSAMRNTGSIVLVTTTRSTAIITEPETHSRAVLADFPPGRQGVDGRTSLQPGSASISVTVLQFVLSLRMPRLTRRCWSGGAILTPAARRTVAPAGHVVIAYRGGNHRDRCIACACPRSHRARG